MPDKSAIKKKAPTELKVCEECGYEGGFHIIVHPDQSPGVRQLIMDFKCPNCGQVYTMGIILSQFKDW